MCNSFSFMAIFENRAGVGSLGKQKLTNKQYLFCLYFARTRDVREAAAKAGYSLFPESAGVKLLQREEIREEIQKLIAAEKGPVFSQLAKKGYERLAFGSVADAVRLLFAGDDFDLEKLDCMDLFCVAEIKRPKNGGMEIKFFDRLKALQCLERMEGPGPEKEGSPFYLALEKGAAAVREGLDLKTTAPMEGGAE